MSEAEGGGAPLLMCDWRDLTSTLVSSCLIYFMTQHISRTTDTTLIPRHTKNTCHDGTRSSRTQKLPTNTPTQSEPIEIQSNATRCSQLSALSSALATATNRANSKQRFECISYGKAMPSFNRGAQIRVKLPPPPSLPSYAQCGMKEPIKSQMRFF